MKTTTVWIFLLFAVFLLFILSKPSDQECIDRIKDRGTGLENIINELLVNSYTINIEDHLFYKSIYSSLDGRCLGYAYLGTVNVKVE